jgi:phosphate transport system substrate-binding protein
MRAACLLLVLAICFGPLGCSGGDDVTVQGSGATFPAPLYKRWFLEFYKQDRDVRINYTPIGSGAGIRQFTAGLTAFGASDAGMSKKEIDKLPEDYANRHGDRVILLPMTAGSIVLSYNVPEVKEGLKLSRKAYMGIFLREITKWNDQEIARHNPGVKLPNRDITVVTRADSSGTTYAFTNHLGAVGKDPRVGLEWKPGVDKSIKWPESIAGQGNDGVAALIQMTPGAIGYLEYGYAELADLAMAELENHHGNFVMPTAHSCMLALEGAAIPKDLQIKVPDPSKNVKAYPIVTYTWILCRGRYGRDMAREVEALKKVLLYCLGDGQRISAELGYIPLPEEVANKAKEALEQIEVAP